MAELPVSSDMPMSSHNPVASQNATSSDMMVVTHFIVSDDVHRSRRFYTDVLGGVAVVVGEPTYVALANSWIIINAGGGPTDDKPNTILETPQDPDRVGSFLNIRVADIHWAYAEWGQRGAVFLTPPKQHETEIRCYLRDPDGYLIEVGQTTTARGWRPPEGAHPHRSDDEKRAALEEHWQASERGDSEIEHAIYGADAILDYPQSGERFQGRDKIAEQRGAHPANRHFTILRIVGGGDLWVSECIITYDGAPSYSVSVMEFADGHVAHETQYFTDPFGAPEWRTAIAEPMPGRDITRA
jgi:catechol 2,3-dioxygenase-like lactoylglutathione lyase family enzyme